LILFDVANPKATGKLLNWTLTLFGELDPSFEGNSTNSFTGDHSIKETSVSHIPVPTHSDITDDTPSRPTKNKRPPKPQSTAATFQIKQYQSTIIYIVSGSLIVFGIATIVYFYRKHNPSNPEKGRQGPPQGYEFQVLQSVPEEEQTINQGQT
jgi:kexin